MTAHDSISAAILGAVSRGTPALVGFLTAGFPNRAGFMENLTAVSGACDVGENNSQGESYTAPPPAEPAGCSPISAVVAT